MIRWQVRVIVLLATARAKMLGVEGYRGSMRGFLADALRHCLVDRAAEPYMPEKDISGYLPSAFARPYDECVFLRAR